ncbi:monoglyceride lipase-like [Olea europaea subsp. europaea]|nr:monoglyceride lipase-like [Olea europaea subsp. europaea]
MVNEANDSSTTLMLTSGASGRVNALLSLRALRSVWLIIYSFVLLLLFPFRGSFYKSSAENGGGSAKEEKSSSQGGVVLRVPRKSSDAVDKEVAARRALSIKRVVEDNGCDETVRQFSLFVTSRGDTMFTQSWTPAKIKVRGLLVLMHGLNEHSGRYSNFAKQLNGYGIKVYAMDWIGHGGSDGLHAYVHSLDDAVTDMKMFLRKVFTENPRLPCFCFGHSTGGAIVLKAVLDPKVSECVSGVILTSPAVGVQPSHPIFALLAPVFSFLLPRFQFSAANKQGIAVSRDPEALRAKYSDPLVFTGSIRIRTGYEILRITSYLQKNLSRIRVPFFVLHGTADAVTDPKASEKLYDEASSSDKTIKLYEGCLHDLLFEPEREEIKDSIISWLNNRL